MNTNCTISDNTANYGGAIACNGSIPNITNCIISGNDANYGGGAWFYRSLREIKNWIMAGNTAGWGGGILCYDADPTITNCILWGDTAASDGNEIVLNNSSTIDVNYCDVKGGLAGIYNDGTGTVKWGNNIDADPLFVDASNPDPNLRDYHLQLGSPCIDAGDNNSVPDDIADLDNDGSLLEPLPLDLDYRDRIADGDCNTTQIVDMGAYEFSSACLGDFDAQCDVDFADYAILTNYWLTDEFSVDIAPTPAGDGIVDERDLGVLGDNWLFGK